MNRTKEIDVKLYETDLKLLDHRGMPVYDKDHLMINEKHFRILKAKLIIELPERKVEITESQFDEACTATASELTVFEIGKGIQFSRALKEKLFGEQA